MAEPAVWCGANRENTMETLTDWLTADTIYGIGSSLLRIVIVLAVAWIAVRVARRALGKLTTRILGRMVHREGQTAAELERQAKTLSGIVVATAVVVIWLFAAMIALKEAGFDIGPLLAGAGVLGLAIGFGAQGFVADVINGAQMLLENQIRIGDVVEINGKAGAVERIGLRTTMLRGLDGTLHIFSNGKIDTLSNMTYEFSFYMFDVGVAYKEDTDRVVEVLQEIAESMRAEEAWAASILEPLDVLGVDRFDDSAVIVKVRLKTLPLRQWAVGREMNRRIKKRFDELGIEIPFPHVSVYFGEASKPVAIAGAELRARS
jgi:small conductance mechanosensitive channel